MLMLVATIQESRSRIVTGLRGKTKWSEMQRLSPKTAWSTNNPAFGGGDVQRLLCGHTLLKVVLEYLVDIDRSLASSALKIAEGQCPQ